MNKLQYELYKIILIFSTMWYGYISYRLIFNPFDYNSNIILFGVLLVFWILPMVVSILFLCTNKDIKIKFTIDDTNYSIESATMYEVFGFSAILPCLLCGTGIQTLITIMRDKVLDESVLQILYNDNYFFTDKCIEYIEREGDK